MYEAPGSSCCAPALTNALTLLLGFAPKKTEPKLFSSTVKKIRMLAIKLQVSFYWRNAVSAEFGGITGAD